MDYQDVDYKNLLKIQNNLCAICKEPETAKTNSGKIRILAMDHCAITKKVRGLLCHRCNVAIGLLKHNVEFLKQAMLYCS